MINKTCLPTPLKIGTRENFPFLPGSNHKFGEVVTGDYQVERTLSRKVAYRQYAFHDFILFLHVNPPKAPGNTEKLRHSWDILRYIAR